MKRFNSTKRPTIPHPTNRKQQNNKQHNIMDHDQDEAIARALAREEQERADEMYARRLLAQQQQEQQHQPSSSSLNRPIDLTVDEDTPPGGVIVQGRPVVSARPPSTSASALSPVNNCPLYHGLNEFLVSYAQRVNCKLCNRTLRRNEKAYGCVACNYDVCERCYRTGGGNNHHRGGRNSHGVAADTARSMPPPLPLPQRPQMMMGPPSPSHMCIVPVVIGGGGGGVCVEMMIDTGAQTSVLSLTLARELGLASRINSMYRGVANGVGTARICGKIQNVVIEFPGSHVEFPCDFIVLDVPDKLLLLGLDLMRRYNCIVNIQKEVLVFGGEGGVEVKMLPANQQQALFRQNPSLMGNGGCPTM